MSNIESYNPSTGELLGSVLCPGPSEVESIVNDAWDAFLKWKVSAYKERKQLVLQLHDLIADEKDEIATLISQEVGKPLAESLLGDIGAVLDACTYFAQNTQKLLQDQSIALNHPFLFRKKTSIVFEPLGVIGIISPWNYPFAIPAIATIMAVLCGNTVVIKASEKSPFVGNKIAELFARAGFPPGVVSVLNGGPEIGALLSQSNLARLIFTGSVQSASKVLTQAAPNLTPVTIEAGGKDAAIVLPDAPVEWTARGLVWSAFTNCGQACASLERAYVVRGAHTVELIEQIAEHTKKLKVGLALDPSTEVGPLVDEIQLAKVVSQIEEAKALGAKVLCGGSKITTLAGHFLEPTVLTNVDKRMSIINEETFGPVLPIVIVDFVEDAIKQVNDSKYALAASIWTADTQQVPEIAERLEAGVVTINDSLFSFACPQIPWGGFKKSGFGRTHSQFGLFDLVNIKTVSYDTAGGAGRFWWYPYGHMRLGNMRAGLDSLHKPSVVGKLLASIRFAAGFWIK
jgi:succinate-semialdehyde dehydrogenase/glutarate-semialdehyde dehydrogenase